MIAIFLRRHDQRRARRVLLHFVVGQRQQQVRRFAERLVEQFGAFLFHIEVDDQRAHTPQQQRQSQEQGQQGAPQRPAARARRHASLVAASLTML